ncbi:protein tyrosine phosphatase type IVA 1-like [Artibeus jamaicensis]|uniref:protein tyrosine phosphatase type IVA 1-like n=1 Tax=Artibeus jamaicensis TaxID=9417 RepID=UPI00235A5BB0|nr:protein tyrosine phosphatase type IVA 1-like [Artibeus jamaicensis]
MARMNCPAPLEVIYKNTRFFITHNPTNVTLNKFIEELKKYGISTIVRVCEATSDTTFVEKEGIHVLHWPFDDGVPPSNQSVNNWLDLVKIKFCKQPGCCIAVQCVACFESPPHRAFNSKELLYLGKYHPKMQLHFKDSDGHRNNCCIQ